MKLSAKLVAMSVEEGKFLGGDMSSPSTYPVDKSSSSDFMRSRSISWLPPSVIQSCRIISYMVIL